MMDCISTPGPGSWYPVPVKVATWNVNGIRARSSQLVHWIDREEPDFDRPHAFPGQYRRIGHPVRDRKRWFLVGG